MERNDLSKLKPQGNKTKRVAYSFYFRSIYFVKRPVLFKDYNKYFRLLVKRSSLFSLDVKCPGEGMASFFVPGCGGVPSGDGYSRN